MTKAGKNEKTKKMKGVETEDAFFAGKDYQTVIQRLTGQIEKFQDIETYTRGARRIFQKTPLIELRENARAEYLESCMIQESCRQIARQYAPRNRSLQERLAHLRSELDSSYNTLNEFLEGSMKYA